MNVSAICCILCLAIEKLQLVTFFDACWLSKGKIRVTRNDEIEIGKDLDENEIAIGFVETTNQLINITSK